MHNSVRKRITPVEWDAIVKRRIQAMQAEWDALSVNNRFWLVLNWFKEHKVLNPSNTKRQLFISKPYWQDCYQQNATDFL